jgi:hypothetical protein
MAANHERDTRQRTATELDPLRDAVRLLADHGYAVTTATIAADPSPEACTTITLELTVPAAGGEGSGMVSAADPGPSTDGRTGDADTGDETGVSGPSADADATESAGEGSGSATLGTTAPLTRREDPGRTGDGRAALTDSSRAGREATDEDASADADGEREEATDERWCRKCGYGPGTKRAIAIHNGHVHGDDAEYVATEPAPKDGAESDAPDRSEEIDAIVESVIAGDSPAADDADTTAQTPGDSADEPSASEQPSDAADSDDSAESTADRSRTDGGDGHSVLSDDSDAVAADSASADASPAEALDEYSGELPDLGFPIPDRITAAAVREAVAGAEDLQDVRESLKWPVGHCRILLEEMGLGEELLGAPPGYRSRRRSKRSV